MTKPDLPTYYNNSKNDIGMHLPSYEADVTGNIKLTDKERLIASSIYDEVGSKATMADVIKTIRGLNGRLNEPQAGYKSNLYDLLTSGKSGLTSPYKGSYLKADNKHRKLVDQLVAHLQRSKIMKQLTEARKDIYVNL